MTENALFLLPALRRARDLIDRDYAEPLDLDAMAGEAGYSRFHFSRAFTAAYGETPRTYLTRRRIERAGSKRSSETTPGTGSASLSPSGSGSQPRPWFLSADLPEWCEPSSVRSLA
jgi:hypothetical protein